MDEAGEPNRRFRVFRARWCILFLHILIGLGQEMVYSTWGPIQNSASFGMGFTQTDFALLPNWYNTIYVFVVFPFTWLIQQYGLRTAEVTTASLIAIGAACRCVSVSSPENDRFWVHLGQIINSMSPIPWIGCTFISAYWFPLHERSLATSIGLSATLIGQAVSFVIGPLFLDHFAPQVNDVPQPPEVVRDAIHRLLYVECIYALIVLILTLVFFRSKPPLPPSFSATVPRYAFGKALTEILRHRQVWVTMSVYAISSAFYLSWHQVLSVFVSPAMSEVEAGWVGFVLCIVGIGAPPIIQMAAPSFIDKHPKSICIFFMVIGCLFFGFMTIASAWITSWFTAPVIWTTMIVSSGAFSALEPMWWEMACEACYPVGESVVSGVFTFASCVLSWFYFVFYMFPQFGTAWATWSVLFAEVAIIPIFLLYQPSFKRSTQDKAVAFPTA